MAEKRKPSARISQTSRRRSQRILHISPVDDVDSLPQPKRRALRKKKSDKKPSAKHQPTQDMPGTSGESGCPPEEGQAEGYFRKFSKNLFSAKSLPRDQNFWHRCGTWAHTSYSCGDSSNQGQSKNDSYTLQLRMKILAKLKEKREKQNQEDQQKQEKRQNDK